jgi:hypothetical protein
MKSAGQDCSFVMQEVKAMADEIDVYNAKNKKA